MHRRSRANDLGIVLASQMPWRMSSDSRACTKANLSKEHELFKKDFYDEILLRLLLNGQPGMRTLSIKEGSRASIYTPDR